MVKFLLSWQPERPLAMRFGVSLAILCMLLGVAGGASTTAVTERTLGKEGLRHLAYLRQGLLSSSDAPGRVQEPVVHQVAVPALQPSASQPVAAHHGEVVQPPLARRAALLEEGSRAAQQLQTVKQGHWSRLRASGSPPRLVAEEEDEAPVMPTESWHKPWKWTLHEVFGFAVLFVGFSLWCVMMPLLVCQALITYHNSGAINSRSFQEYLMYRFTRWFSTSQCAMAVILCVLVLTLVVAGAMLYWVLVGESPVNALWKSFVWASASSAEPEKGLGGRFVGIVMTLGGFIVLALLLGIVTETFVERMEAFKEGRNPIVEGHHTVILGYSRRTRYLIEEVALGLSDSDSVQSETIAVLDERPKRDLERQLQADEVTVSEATLVVRSGRSHISTDLRKVAADTARVVIIQADTNLTREKADAKTIRTLLTLKGKGWPVPENSYVVAQCCTNANSKIMKDILGDKLEVLVVGVITAELMAHSALEHGLAQVFSRTIGFDGDEFYILHCPEVVGKTYRDCLFRFPTAVPIGVLDEKGNYNLNPHPEYAVKQTDKMIVLAENKRSVFATKVPTFDFEAWCESRAPVQHRDSEARKGAVRVLISGFNPQGPAVTLVAVLEASLQKGSVVDIYSNRSIEECEHIVKMMKVRRHLEFKNITVNHIFSATPTARDSINDLPLHDYSEFFITPDVTPDHDECAADTDNIAVIVQMQTILGNGLMAKPFDPVVEVCEPTTKEHLNLLGITNSLNSNLLIARSLAVVAVERHFNGIVQKLLSVDGTGEQFDVCDIADFLPPGEPIPKEMSFLEATAYVCWASSCMTLVGWSAGSGVHRDWDMNPLCKDKPRPWLEDDRLVVIKKENSGSSKLLRRPSTRFFQS